MDLPEHLVERCRWLSESKAPVGNGPVIVWLKSLFRVHENPAVDVGRWMAHHHGRPLLILPRARRTLPTRLFTPPQRGDGRRR